MSSRNPRVAVVTGASRGIGRRIAERLARADYVVVVGYGSDSVAAQKVVGGIVEADGRAIAVGGDIGDETTVAELFETAEREFGGVDVVVHSAAVLPVAPLADLTVEQIDRVLRTNLRSALLVGQQAARRVRAGGAIVMISSAITKNFSPGYSAYAASKAGLEAIAATLARELRGREITVNAVAPGPTETEMLLADLDNSGNPEQTRQAMAEASPLGRIGTPDDIADAVLALAGTVRWVNGQTIHASGGMV